MCPNTFDRSLATVLARTFGKVSSTKERGQKLNTPANRPKQLLMPGSIPHTLDFETVTSLLELGRLDSDERERVRVATRRIGFRTKTDGNQHRVTVARIALELGMTELEVWDLAAHLVAAQSIR